MATFNEDDIRKRTSSEGTIKDIEDTLVSDDENLDEYGVWVKSGPDDIGESNFDEEFEISDLSSTLGEDLLTEEEESLLSDFEEHAETDERLPDIELSDSDFPRQSVELDLPDLDETAFDIGGVPEESSDETDSFDMDIPMEEPVSIGDDEISTSGDVEPAFDDELESSILNDLPEIDSSPAEVVTSSVEEDGLSEDDFTIPGGDIPSSAEAPVGAADSAEEDSSSASSDSFMEISLDSFGEPEEEESSELEDNFFEEEPAEEPTAEDDFLDLDFEDEAKEADSGSDDSLFTTEELDDFFGVPVEDSDTSGEISADDEEKRDASSGVDDGRPSIEPAIPEVDDFSELNMLDDDDAGIEAGTVAEGTAEESFSEKSFEDLGGDELPDLPGDDISSTEEVDPEPLFIDENPATEESTIGDSEEVTGLPFESAEDAPSVVEESVLESGIRNVESKITEAKSNPSLDTSILVQIERELSSIRAELSGLKEELSSLRQKSVSVSPEEEQTAENEKTSGFFDEDEDETIALTGDELDNILNTADITEASGEEDISGVDIGTADTFGDGNFVSRDEEIIPLEDTESMTEPESSADEGITLIEVPDGEDASESFFDEQPGTMTDSDTEGTAMYDSALPVFEEVDTESEEAEDEAFTEVLSEDDVKSSDAEDDETSVFIPEEAGEEIFLDENLSAGNELQEASSDAEKTAEAIGNGIENVSDVRFQTLSEKEELRKDDTAADSVPLEGSIRDEIKSVLSYMDTLLEALPEDKIEEFARSEHFDVYRKLFEELGLGK